MTAIWIRRRARQFHSSSSSPGLEDWYEATGLIESGEFQGRKVNLGFISSGVGDTRMLRVNPAELKLEAVDQ